MRLTNTSRCFIVGIDEAGRGALAGPVSVGVVVIYKKRCLSKFLYVKDSKKLSARAREYWYQNIKEAQRRRELDFQVSFSKNAYIDRHGIVRAVRQALECALRKLKADPRKVRVLLDGGLKAPEIYCNQLTIIKGDEKERVIALASIVAKVERDRKMVRYEKKFPTYGFGIHKGYGTQLHYTCIRERGVSQLHRKSFLKEEHFLFACRKS